jgi:hypothetical protein
MSRARTTCAAAIAVALLGACRPSGPPALPPVHALAPGFLARQTVIARVQGRPARFDAVVQASGDELLLLGLTPMGTKAFAVRQRGTEVTVERFVDAPLPAPAEAVLLDIHRAWLDDRPTQARADGWHRRRVTDARGEVVRIDERWAGGRLYERVWGRHRDDKADRVRWPDGLAIGEMPKLVELDHPSLGLMLAIHTVEIRTLDRGVPH